MKKLLYIFISTSNLLLLGSQKDRKFMKDTCNRTYWSHTVEDPKEHSECSLSRFEVYDEIEKKYIAHIAYSPSNCYINFLRVSEEYKKQGLGAELAKRALAELKNSGCRDVFLDSSPEGRGFWRKLGAQPRNGSYNGSYYDHVFPDTSSNVSYI